MPLQLDTPHTYNPGHGAAPEVYPLLFIRQQTVDTFRGHLVLKLSYGVLDARQPRGWRPSPEAPKPVRLRNVPAVTQPGLQTVEIEDPDDPEQTIEVEVTVEVEVTPANPVFDNLLTGFVIQQADVGERAWDVVADFMYQILIDAGLHAGTVI